MSTHEPKRLFTIKIEGFAQTLEGTVLTPPTETLTLAEWAKRIHAEHAPVKRPPQVPPPPLTPGPGGCKHPEMHVDSITPNGDGTANIEARCKTCPMMFAFTRAYPTKMNFDDGGLAESVDITYEPITPTEEP